MSFFRWSAVKSLLFKIDPIKFIILAIVQSRSSWHTYGNKTPPIQMAISKETYTSMKLFTLAVLAGNKYLARGYAGAPPLSLDPASSPPPHRA